MTAGHASASTIGGKFAPSLGPFSGTAVSRAAAIALKCLVSRGGAGFAAGKIAVPAIEDLLLVNYDRRPKPMCRDIGPELVHFGFGHRRKHGR